MFRWIFPTIEENVYDVFLSYAREDAERMIECRLCLEARGFSVCVDDRIQAGEKWRESLRHRYLNEAGDADAARQDLAEAQEIAAFSNMRLHLLDIRLEQAVWALREGSDARALLDETAELLAQTHCTRRAPELKALREIVR